MSIERVETEWEPGVPLYSMRTHPNSQYFYNFRSMNDESEQCCCNDSARWPKTDNRYHWLPDDPLAEFIREFHDQEARK